VADLPVRIDARQARVGASQFVDAVHKMRAGAAQATRDTNELDKATNKFGNTAKTVTRIVGGLFATVGTTIAFRQAVGIIADFEFVMSQVKGVSGATAEEFGRLEDSARELGATTEFSATQAGDALLSLSRAGFEANESIASLEPTLNLATAAAIGLGDSAAIVAGSLRQFQLPATEAERVTDTFLNTANSAATNVTELSEAMKLAGPVAAQLGRSIEETSATVGVLGDFMIQGSMAGTNLRGILAAILDPTEKAMYALREMGIALEDIDPATKSLSEIFKVFRDRGLDAGKAVEIFGRRNVAAALALASAADRVEALTKANEAAAGEAKRMAEIMRNTLRGSINNLKSAVEELFLKTGDAGLSGALRRVVDVATETIRMMVGLKVEVDENTRAAEVLLRVLQGVAVALAAIVAIKAVVFLKTVTLGFYSAGLAIATATASLLGYNVAMSAATAQTVALVAIISKAIAVVTVFLSLFSVSAYVSSNSQAVQVFMSEVILGFRQTVETISLLAKSAVESVTWLIDKLSQGMVLFGADFIAALQKITTVGGPLLSRLGVDVQGLNREFQETIDTLRTQAGELGGADLSSRLNPLIDESIAHVQEAVELHKSAVEQIKRDLADGPDPTNWSDFFDWVGDKLDGYKQKLKDSLGLDFGMGDFNIPDKIKIDLPDVDPTMLEAINKAVEGLSQPTDQREGINFLTERIGLVEQENQLVGKSAELRKVEQEVLQASIQADKEMLKGKDALLQRLREALTVQVQTNAVEDVRERVRQLEQEADLIGKTAGGKEQENELLKARNALQAVGLDQDHEAYVQLEAIVALLQKKKVEEAFDKVIEGLQKEREAIGQTNAERRFTTALEQARTVVQEKGLDLSSQQEASVRREIQAINDKNAALKFNEILRDMEEQNRLLLLGNAERERELILARARKAVEEEGGRFTAWHTDQIEQQVQQTEELRKIQAMSDLRREFALEREMILMSDEERERAIRLEGIKQDMRSQGIELTQQDIALIDEQIRQTQKLEERMAIFRDIAREAGQEIAEQFELMTWEAKSFKDALRDVTKEISRMVFKQMVTQQLANLITGGLQAGFAAGVGASSGGGGGSTSAVTAGLRGGGNLGPQQYGGVFMRPTDFQTSGGETGIFGESGPEAVMPLGRDSKGRLGVMANGEAGGSRLTQNVTMHVHTPDADSFRRSQTQISADLHRVGRSFVEQERNRGLSRG